MKKILLLIVGALGLFAVSAQAANQGAARKPASLSVEEVQAPLDGLVQDMSASNQIPLVGLHDATQDGLRAKIKKVAAVLRAAHFTVLKTEIAENGNEQYGWEGTVYFLK
jgi:hypothetical protein